MKKFIFVLAFTALTSPLFSQWSTDPAVNNVVSDAGGQSVVATCIDGAGGVIVTWMENYKIKVQRVNSFGQNLWTTNGVLLSSPAKNSVFPSITSDGAGGAIIVWLSYAQNQPYNLYAQRVRSDGVLMWDSAVTVNAVPSYGYNLDEIEIIGAEAGGCIIGWTGGQPNTGFLFVQKLDAYGNRVWDSNDVQISFGTTFSADMCKDGKNGVFIVYNGVGPNSGEFFAQHVNSFGDTLWNANSEIVNAQGQQMHPVMCEDQNYGFIVAWEDYRNFSSSHLCEIYAMRIDSNGNNLWNSNGNLIVSIPNVNLSIISCISDAHGGAHIVWVDPSYAHVFLWGEGIVGQNIDYNGQKRWGTNGVVLAGDVDFFITSGNRYSPKVSSVDALGGLIIAWVGYSGPGPGLIDRIFATFAQKIDYYGVIQWDSLGTLVATEGFYSSLSMVPDGGSGGINIAWCGAKNNGSTKIYAQHVKSNSTLGNRPGAIPLGLIKSPELKQNYPNPFNPVTKISFAIPFAQFISLKIYDMTGREVVTLADGVYDMGEHAVTWNASNFSTGIYFYKLTANERTEVKKMMLIK